jgi:hypothetical protein
MLKITQNVFESVREKLDFSVEDSVSDTTDSCLCGTIIPDQDDVLFSEENASATLLGSHIERTFKDVKWLLFAMDSAWQMDTPRMRHLGLKTTLGTIGKSGSEISAAKILLSEEGKIRHAGLVGFTRNQIHEVTHFIAHNPRHTFLIADLAMNQAPSDLLELICKDGIYDVLHSKRQPFFRWKCLVSLSADRRIVFGTVLGWAEEHCDLRYILMGVETNLKHLIGSEFS